MPFTDEDRQIAFIVRQWLQKQKGNLEEANLEVVEQCLSEAFGLDAEGGNKYNLGVDLVAAFRDAAAKSKAEGSGASSDKGFQDFLNILTSKGYFQGLEKGTPAYEDRLSKAKAKYEQRNSPYAGMSAEDLKTKGNSKMMTGEYNDAALFYTKAIELDPSNAVYFANRAAAYTHLKQYAKAVADGERAVTIDNNYSKAHSRLGTALFYEGEYRRAVVAYEKAVELDPTNEPYAQDLKAAKDKLSEIEAGAGALGGLGAGGLGAGAGAGFPGMGGFGQFLNNPDFLRMAADVMANPNFNSMIRSFADTMQSGNMDMSQMFGQLAAQNPFGAAPEGGDDTLRTPLGNLSRADIEELQNSPEVKENPKIQAIMEECKTQGLGAMMKYMGDPEVMSAMSGLTTKLLSRVQKPAEGAPPS